MSDLIDIVTYTITLTSTTHLVLLQQRGNKKRKIIELAAINLESKLNLRGNKLA